MVGVEEVIVVEVDVVSSVWDVDVSLTVVVVSAVSEVVSGVCDVDASQSVVVVTVVWVVVWVSSCNFTLDEKTMIHVKMSPDIHKIEANIKLENNIFAFIFTADDDSLQKNCTNCTNCIRDEYCHFTQIVSCKD